MMAPTQQVAPLLPELAAILKLAHAACQHSVRMPYMMTAIMAHTMCAIVCGTAGCRRITASIHGMKPSAEATTVV